jgi:hypothetical protein
MKNSGIYLGDAPLKSHEGQIAGGFENIDGEEFYKISNYDLMPDFFMTIVSDSDHWMFLSSNGSLSAGRKNRDNALFPYYTDDKIHDYQGQTGSKTIILVKKSDKAYLWEPFNTEQNGIYSCERNLYKSIYGNKIIFEEVNIDLGLSFRYGWYNSDEYGFVKKSRLVNLGKSKTRVGLLDGIVNLLPYGVDYAFQNEYSNLLDAYKKNELLPESGLGIFTLSSIPVDRAEPSESLVATTVWSRGLADYKILVSDNQVGNFRRGLPVHEETDIRARRGAFYVHGELNMAGQQDCEWITVAEINQCSTDVANLNNTLMHTESISDLVEQDIQKGTRNLVKIVAAADGLQCSHEDLCSARHFSNTLFNVMRGGIFLNGYTIDSSDLKNFILQTNKKVYAEVEGMLNDLPAEIKNHDLINLAEKSGNKDFIRICYEYLPVTFSRRHGDPSRPWNQFSIENRNSDGSPRLDFQGNWRDIFQNWEALSLSYPEYIENIISKFVNASTADGYNPYRIMRDGIDWERPDPHDPWAYIGYWGDHQIIYLQKLLELSSHFHPGKLEAFLTEDIFAYANVPYRLKPYDEMVKNPQDTIVFDYKLDKKISGRVEDIGSDGRLLMQKDGSIYQVNLTEKILATLLSKLSNFIPEAGIWMNTQRPEWNDANNALVGNGVSMVTLYYLRRFLKFWNEFFKASSFASTDISEEMKELFDAIRIQFAENIPVLEKGFSDEERRSFTDILGKARTSFREKVYEGSFSGKTKKISKEELIDFTELALAYLDQSIRVNKREDGLYHAYNLISFSEKGATIRHLYEMLEGQVALLSSGFLSAQESLDVLNALKKSSLFRSDQYSYLLYPDRELPRFINKNNLSDDQVKSSALLTRLAADKNNPIVQINDTGNYHFLGSFRNADVLAGALDSLDEEKYGPITIADKEQVLAIFEELFDHQSFTGRSGTFYGYEGLGSIYWHMVSKLLLATEECFFKAVDEKADPALLGAIQDHYYEIKAGIGLYKSPELYGAFPTDAYSHTPGNAGAKQPGMTGQVKEDFISRMGELGVHTTHGEIVFDTPLFNPDEFATKACSFEYYDVNSKQQKLTVKPDQFAFTFCQVPVVYTRSDQEEIVLSFKDGKREKITGHAIGKEWSQMVFDRGGEITLIEVAIKK